MKKIFLYICLLCTSVSCLVSCTKFLDEKSDKSLSLPKSLTDLQALLDAYGDMNEVYSYAGEEASDDYFLSTKNWQGIANQDTRNNYIWNDDAKLNSAWIAPYKVIFVCNTVLEEVEEVNSKNQEQDYQRIKGTALFFRAFAHYEVASLFAPVYAPDNIDKLGIPVRLATAVEDDTPRSTVGHTYGQIIVDLKTAIDLLPVSTAYKNRPTKRTAYSLLARIYLAMSDYANALDASNQALSFGKELLDYNAVDLNLAAPFSLQNEEIIWLAGSNSVSPLLAPARCRIDTVLYASYTANDLRKKAFFTKNLDGYYTFKGTYDSRVQGYLFKGLAVNELYLIKAECEIRTGNTVEGLKTLAILLRHRYETGLYPVDSGLSRDKALQFVLDERRKELPFRGLRWSDLKRLNLVESSAKTLVRKLDQQVYQLSPNDLRYVFLIPNNVIMIAGFPQNPR